MKKTTLLVSCFVVALATNAWAQCSTQSATTPVRLEQGRSTVAFESPDHNAADPSGAALITEYRGEVALQSGGAAVTNWTIPKGAAVAVSGQAGCYSAVLPMMGGLLPANNYVLRIQAVNPTGASALGDPSNPFFLPGAARVPTNTRVRPVPLTP